MVMSRKVGRKERAPQRSLPQEYFSALNDAGCSISTIHVVPVSNCQSVGSHPEFPHIFPPISPRFKPRTPVFKERIPQENLYEGVPPGVSVKSSPQFVKSNESRVFKDQALVSEDELDLENFDPLTYLELVGEYSPHAASGKWGYDTDSEGDIVDRDHTNSLFPKRTYGGHYMDHQQVSGDESDDLDQLPPMGPYISADRTARSSSARQRLVDLKYARLFVLKAIEISGEYSCDVPTQKQIQAKGMTTTKQQKARNFLKLIGAIKVSTRTELAPQFPSLGHLKRYLESEIKALQ